MAEVRKRHEERKTVLEMVARSLDNVVTACQGGQKDVAEEITRHFSSFLKTLLFPAAPVGPAGASAAPVGPAGAATAPAPARSWASVAGQPPPRGSTEYDQGPYAETAASPTESP